MNKMISRIENNIQDRNSQAWIKLCDYIEKIAEQGNDEFAPLEELGPELFSQIFTLPESISKLKKVKKLWLYGSKLKRIPPEIGEMEALEYFDPYTSYDLHWFPYEITNCKKLKKSRVSTRALYGNYKYRMGFPQLKNNPIRYFGDKVMCSVCKKVMDYSEANQFWISLCVGTDILPLLVNVCSIECENNLPSPPENYVQFPHKGGSELIQPPNENEIWEKEMARRKNESEATEINDNDLKVSDKKIEWKDIKPIKLIRKIWER